MYNEFINGLKIVTRFTDGFESTEGLSFDKKRGSHPMYKSCLECDASLAFAQPAYLK